MKVVIAGETPFIEEVGELCTQAGHDTVLYLIEDFLSALQGASVAGGGPEIDVVIELHNESADAKQELLFGIGHSVSPDALILSSALATSATVAASWVPMPERVVGFSILPPLKRDGIVELAPALQTAEAATKRAVDFWRGLGQEVVTVADGAGLVRARIVCCLINEAVGALMEGVATAADIDKAMRLGTNFPYGPLEWADYLGIDTVLGVMAGLFEEWGEDRYRPSPLLKRMVAAGRLGKKTGEGFYKYGD